MGNLIDLNNKKFGKWNVIKKTKSKNKKTMWLCKCECGIENEVESNNLRSGKSTQCRSCSNKQENLLNKIFENWTVIKKIKGTTKWLCKCKCGKELEIYGSALTTGKRKQCRKCYSDKQRHHVVNSCFLHRSKNNAKKRNYEFSITKDDILSLYYRQNKKCRFCQDSIVVPKTQKEFKNCNNIASIDRIDNNKGYNQNNIQLTCLKCNLGKQSMSDLEYINHCKKVVNLSK